MSDCPGCVGDDWAVGCQICELKEENELLWRCIAVVRKGWTTGQPSSGNRLNLVISEVEAILDGEREE